METSFRQMNLDAVFPVQCVRDGAVISKRGDVTLGWEVELPRAFSLTEDGYDDILSAFNSAVRILPPWTMVHRQDWFLHDRYVPCYDGRFLHDAYESHFAGRRFLTHRQFLFLTMASKGSGLRPNQQTAAFGIRFSAQLPGREEIARFSAKAGEFISILTSGGRLGARRLTDGDFLGEGNEAGLLQRYTMLGSHSPLMTDIAVEGGERLRIRGLSALAFKVSESDGLPGEMENVCRVDELSSPSSKVFLSHSSALGVRLDCEHFVNQYILVPPQGQFLTDLDRKRRKMTSMSSSADNRVAAEEIAQYIDEVHRDSLLSVYSHMNVIAWGEPDGELELKGKVSAALSSMGVAAVQSLSDVPSLFLAGVPGAACEIGLDNLMRHELRSMLCLGLNETFERPMEGGLFRICDRLRNIPIDIDVQRLARDGGHIDNYNAFLLGPSGSGKSFFMNSFLRNCYDAGEHIFLIDVGDSYEGLCEIIRETSGGRDGFYHSWDPEHPFSFNPFVGFREWRDEGGHLRQDHPGVTFLVSFLTTAWTPDRGWTTDSTSVLLKVVADFIGWASEKFGEGLPVFDDFYTFLSRVVVPRIVPERDARGDIVALPRNPYIVGGGPVSPADFDIYRFLRALEPYSAQGAFSFLLNDPHPRDLFASRFTVFEVDRLSQSSDKVFYSLCILCILNAFDTKMRTSDAFKLMVIEEAWKAIANETMAPYLRGLWKTARKFQTSAMVVTQQVSDIMSSEVISDAILKNSDVKFILEKNGTAEDAEAISTLLGLPPTDKDLILSMNRSLNPAYRYREVYIRWNDRSGVYATEVSTEEALAFESDKVRKKPLYDLARRLGSIRDAIDAVTSAGGVRI